VTAASSAGRTGGSASGGIGRVTSAVSGRPESGSDERTRRTRGAASRGLGKSRLRVLEDRTTLGAGEELADRLVIELGESRLRVLEGSALRGLIDLWCDDHLERLNPVLVQTQHLFGAKRCRFWDEQRKQRGRNWNDGDDHPYLGVTPVSAILPLTIRPPSIYVNVRKDRPCILG
jgi:hypothetical protein